LLSICKASQKHVGRGAAEDFEEYVHQAWYWQPRKSRWPGVSDATHSDGVTLRRRTIDAKAVRFSGAAVGPASFRALWPLLAQDLSIAEWKIRGAQAGSRPTETPLESFDPPRVQPQDWRRLYADELAAHPGLAADLADESQPFSLIMDRAKLSPAEREVVWLLVLDEGVTCAEQASEVSLSAAARRLKRQKRAVRTLLERALFKLRRLGAEERAA
jgi:hypothetical protein